MTAILGIVEDGPRYEHKAHAMRELLRRIGAKFRIVNREASSGAIETAARDEAILYYGAANLDLPAAAARTVVQIYPSAFFAEGFDRTLTIGEIEPINSAPCLHVAPIPQNPALPPMGKTALATQLDFIASTYYLLAAHADRLDPERDEFGRFPASNFLLAQNGLIDQPLVDYYAQRIAKLLTGAGAAFPAQAHWPNNAPLAAMLTSDIDLPRAYRLRTAAKHLLKADLKGAMANWPRASALDANFQQIAGVQQRASNVAETNIPWTYYFLAGKRSRLDAYSLPDDPELSALARDFAADGHEIGLHAPLRCWQNPADYEVASAAFACATGARPRAVRQHYLRLDLPSTWRAQAAAGFEYDASAAFSKREGFRFGTALPFQAFDSDAAVPLGLWVMPLTIMDVTLRVHRGLPPVAAATRIHAAIDRAASVGGIFSLLWHNTSFGGDWREWEAVFDSTVGRLANRGAWFATGRDIFERWRDACEALAT